MAEFAYTAITKEGKIQSSIIQAPNVIAAGHLLKEQGLLPMQIKEATSKSFLDFLRSITTVSLQEKIVFIENLSIMLKAGISLTRGMQILVKQTSNLRFKNILSDIQSQVQSGKSLADSLAKYPNIFSNIFISMIRVGELSGNLDKSLEYLNIQLQREAEIRSKTRGAMIYPAIIVTAMIIIGVLMAIFVLPKLTSIFKEFKTNLPLSTRIVVGVADFMSAHGFLTILGMIAVVFSIIAIYWTYSGKKYIELLMLHFFIIKDIVKKINLARFFRILGSLLKSGTPIVESLQVASGSLTNIHYREIITQAANNVKVGNPLTETLDKDKTLFPILVVQMLQVGEESGTLENILEELAVHYEAEVDNTMRNLSSIIEPLLLLFIGGIVGFLALALISTIYNIGESIK